jgi:hypothetical protein
MPDYNKALVDDLRAHKGEASSGHFVGRPMLILTTTGAKTGLRRTAEVGGETFEAHATVVDEPERRRLYDRHAAAHTGLGFKGYETKTSRVIPVIVLERETSATD